MRFLPKLAAAGLGALFAIPAAHAVPFTAQTTSPLVCAAGTCSYSATSTQSAAAAGTNASGVLLTDFQVDFNIPQFGSTALPVGAVISGMSVTITGGWTTAGTVSSSNGASGVSITTGNATTTGPAVGTLNAGPAVFGGFNGGSGNFTLTKQSLGSQTIGTIGAGGSAAVSYVDNTLPMGTLMSFTGIDSNLIGAGVFTFEMGTSTFVTLGSTSGNVTQTVTSTEVLNLNVTYNYSIDCRLTPDGCGVPEPASMSLLGMGLVGLGAFARRRRAAK